AREHPRPARRRAAAGAVRADVPQVAGPDVRRPVPARDRSDRVPPVPHGARAAARPARTVARALRVARGALRVRDRTAADRRARGRHGGARVRHRRTAARTTRRARRAAGRLVAARSQVPALLMDTREHERAAWRWLALATLPALLLLAWQASFVWPF